MTWDIDFIQEQLAIAQDAAFEEWFNEGFSDGIAGIKPVETKENTAYTEGYIAGSKQLICTGENCIYCKILEEEEVF